METAEILRILREEIHSAVFATVDEQGLPATRVIDIMLTDEDSLYFITAKGKAFYRQLTDRKYAAVSGMTQGKGSLERKAVLHWRYSACMRGRANILTSQQNPWCGILFPWAAHRKDILSAETIILTRPAAAAGNVLKSARRSVLICLQFHM